MPSTIVSRRRFLCIPLLAGCSRKSKDPGIGRIRFGVSPHLSMAGIHLAHEMGLFQRLGLDIELVVAERTPEVLALLAGGKIEAGSMAIGVGLVNAIVKGATLRLVATRDGLKENCRDNSRIHGSRATFPGGLRSVSQLRGKRVAIGNRFGMPGFYLSRHLEAAKMTEKELTLLNLRGPDANAALAMGRIDAIMGNDTDADMTFSSNIVPGPSLASVFPGFQHSFHIFGDRLLKTDPSVGARILAACLEGVRQFQAGKTPKFTEQFAGSRNTDIKTWCRYVLSNDGRLRLDYLQMYLDWATRMGYLQSPVKAEQIVDTRFVEMANRQSF
ncbi:MAG: ABC transporter substrate-binding protein [Bryobacteraceae bacterium]